MPLRAWSPKAGSNSLVRSMCGADDFVVGLELAIRTPVIAHELPDVLNRVRSGERIGGSNAITGGRLDNAKTPSAVTSGISADFRNGQLGFGLSSRSTSANTRSSSRPCSLFSRYARA
jgi:hypothetical protein